MLLLLNITVVKTMRDKYRKCLDFCKDLNRPNIIKSLDNISADKLLYEYAIKMCQSGAIEEIVGVRAEASYCLYSFVIKQLLIFVFTEFQTLPNGTDFAAQSVAAGKQ